MADLPQLNTDAPNPARRYNYWLGGKDHFAADRASGDEIAKEFPEIVAAARANRDFLGRAVRFLAGEGKIRQFLDIGTGIPAPGNTHEVAQGMAPKARVVYVDIDPLVMVHARALATSGPQGSTDYIKADLREPAEILNAPQLHATLDLGQPVAVLLVAVLHFLTDDDQARLAVGKLIGAMPAGSYVLISHATSELIGDHDPTRLHYLMRSDGGHGPFKFRTGVEITALVDGMELVEPGLVPIQAWHSDPGSTGSSDDQLGMYAVVARKAG